MNYSKYPKGIAARFRKADRLLKKYPNARPYLGVRSRRRNPKFDPADLDTVLKELGL